MKRRELVKQIKESLEELQEDVGGLAESFDDEESDSAALLASAIGCLQGAELLVDGAAGAMSKAEMAEEVELEEEEALRPI